MAPSESKEYLDTKAVISIVFVTLLWGLNYVAIKYSNPGIAPVFASTLRSLVALACGALYGLSKGERLFHTDIRLFHGCIAGLLLGLEIACIYLGLLYTDAARSAVFVYTNPFIVALGAHFFLRGDRLTSLKITGLVLAFVGVVIIFQGRPRTAPTTMFIGDVLQLMAAVFWGATTVYIKKFMAEKVHPINTFLYQLFFSIPVLLIVSLVLEPKWIYRIDLPVTLSLFYQSFIVAFASYFAWFKLIHRYSVSRLSAFLFFTPIFGVLLSVLFLGEEFTLSLMIGLPLVCLGIYLVNRKRRRV
jgi:drug/metabolite transporter (DMT)-like permease